MLVIQALEEANAYEDLKIKCSLLVSSGDHVLEKI